MAIKLPSLHFLYAEARQSLLRFPFTLFFALCSFLLAYQLNHLENSNSDLKKQLSHLILASTLGIPLSFALSLLTDNKPRVQKWLLQSAIFPIVAIAYYWVKVQDGEIRFYLYALLSLCFHLFVAFAAKLTDRGFWQFNQSLFLRFILSFIFSNTFFCGLSLALLALSILFGVEIRELYFDLWLATVFIFNTWHFISGLPKDIQSFNHQDLYPKSLKIFTQYLLIPLLSLYFIILYAYLIKIIFQWKLPEGTVAYLVSTICVFGVFTMLLIHPIQEKVENRWISIFSRGFYLGIFPLILLMGLGLKVRIQHYGITESRYLLLMLTIWLLALAAYFTFSSLKKIKIIPISLFVLILLCTAGPWSVFAISFQSQKSRLEKLLNRHQMFHPESGKMQKSPQLIKIEDRKEISSILKYLVDRHGLDSVRAWIPENANIDENNQNYNLAADILKSIDIDYIWEGQESSFKDGFFNFTLDYNTNPVIVTHGYDYLMEFNSNEETNRSIEGTDLIFKFNPQHELIISKAGKKIAVVSILDYALKLQLEKPLMHNRTFQTHMIYSYENNSISMKFLIETLYGHSAKGKEKIESWRGKILIRVKNDP